MQDTAKSAKNNTSDWKADWKNLVSWHRLIKLCCFSHQDCQQKAKHIASIQFSLQLDSKWHSFLTLLRAIPPCLPTILAGNYSALRVHQSCSSPGMWAVVLLSLASAKVPRDRALQVYTLNTEVFSWQRARSLSDESTCSSGVCLQTPEQMESRS